jgi:hypothetical protein
MSLNRELPGFSLIDDQDKDSKHAERLTMVNVPG